MATSMADHLREQEYSRIRRSEKVMLAEPPISEEAAGILAEAYESYEHDETSPEEYLSIVTEQRGFTPASTQHAVMINSGSYCSNTGLPIIMKAFLNDNGNAVVKEVLEHYGVVMLDKIPSGGVLIHVRSANDEAKLDGQEVNLMGRKFTIKRRSFLMNKFFLDVSGIHAVEEANALFLALSALGAHPLFLTPRDVNIETHVVSPTWRFYFGSEAPPKCLVVDGCVTHQLIYGRNLYLTRGKRSISMDPPIRATTRRQSRYGVVLPFRDDRSRHEASSHSSHQEEPNTQASTSSLISARENPVPATSSMTGAVMGRNLGVGTEVMSSNPAPVVESAQHGMLDSPTGEHELAEPDNGAIATNEQWVTQGGASTDIDMSKHLESGFKRLEPSFIHENPYAALNQLECDFEIVQPVSIQGTQSGVFIIPHFKPGEREDYSGPAPSKKRAKAHEQSDPDDALLLEEALLQSEQEAQLIKRNDKIEENAKRLKATESLLGESKNMDLIVKSICEVPMAWTTAFFKDIVEGGTQIMDLADIHLWNRALAAETMDDDLVRTFHDRISSLNLPIGNSRDHYTTYLKAAFGQLPSKEQNDWNLLRWLNLFELLALGMCPAVFTQQGWMRMLIEHASGGLPHSHVTLLSDGSLLKLLRSRLGKIILSAVSNAAPGSAIVQGLQALQASNLSTSDLPVLSTNLLTYQPTTPAMAAVSSN